MLKEIQILLSGSVAACVADQQSIGSVKAITRVPIYVNNLIVNTGFLQLLSDFNNATGFNVDFEVVDIAKEVEVIASEMQTKVRCN